MDDRRSFPRIAKRLAISFVIEGRPCLGNTRDLSVVGLFVETGELPPSGADLPLVVEVPERGDLHLETRVVRLEPSPPSGGRAPGFAVQVLRLNERWVDFAEEVRSPSGPFRGPSLGNSSVLRAVSRTSAARLSVAPPDPLLDIRLIRILLVDPDEETYELLRRLASGIEVGSYKLEQAKTPSAALGLLAEKRHEICLVSAHPSFGDVVSFIRESLARAGNAAVIVLMPLLDRKLEMQALQAGAADALDRSVLDPRQLERSVRFSIVRENAAKELRLLRKAVETMQLGMIIKDPKGTILFANPAMAEMLGYPLEELIGKHAGLLAPPELRREQTGPELASLTPWARESVNVRKDGTRVRVRLTSDVVTDRAGIPIGVVTSAQRIS